MKIFDKINKNYHLKLPFVAYRKPNKNKVLGKFLKTDDLVFTSSFTESGFVFAPFDDQRNTSLGCYGHPIIRTPNIDQLAAHGTRFTNAFVTTSICAAFDHGVKEIIPVSGLDEARSMKEKGYFVACERNGEVLDFADIGNSASDFIREDLIGQSVVFSTTNGTKTINMARDASEVVIGSFTNIQALADHLVKTKKNVVIFCAAWKNLFNLEDAVFAGALAEILLNNEFSTVCDSVHGAVDLWHRAKPDLKNYLSKIIMLLDRILLKLTIFIITY